MHVPLFDTNHLNLKKINKKLSIVIIILQALRLKFNVRLVSFYHAVLMLMNLVQTSSASLFD